MDDMHAFERQVERRIHRSVGPVRPVDDLAVFEAVIATTQSSKWRFTMFSALRFVAAGVIVALFGGFLVTGVLTTQQGDEVVPAAVTASPSLMTTEEAQPMPAAFTATLNWDDGETGSVEFGDDGVVRHRGLVSDMRILESTDPRFSGAGTWIASLDQRDQLGLVFNAAFRFENEAGAWQEVPHVWFRREGLPMFSPVTSVFVGEGAYEGWTIVAEIVDTDDVTGVIFEGPVPPLPDSLEPSAE